MTAMAETHCGHDTLVQRAVNYQLDTVEWILEEFENADMEAFKRGYQQAEKNIKLATCLG